MGSGAMLPVAGAASMAAAAGAGEGVGFAAASRGTGVVPGGMSETTVVIGSVPPVGSGPTICSRPSAIAPMVAAAARGNHHRSGRVASRT